MLYTAKGYIEVDSAKLIKEHMPLVKQIASSIYKKINFAIELNDLIQCGSLGLLDAITKYVKNDSAKFETYATTRIRGSILDELRKNDHLNQDERHLYKSIKDATHILSNHKANKPTDSEIAQYCGITIDDYYCLINKNNINYFVSLENEKVIDIEDETQNIELEFQKKEIHKQITSKIKELSEKEQIVMQLIYVEDLDSKEAAVVMNLTPARISQLHAQAILKLKSELAK
ncbi:FliA/WhiG family RNA polymerase sigma factor [archaeon]|nr:FliA/WhiG family RNA polymerase sigma factor [archaeon]